jgi:peptidoglycan/xylan/chitin deacetylase (PgdA/CDA1 family)
VSPRRFSLLTAGLAFIALAGCEAPRVDLGAKRPVAPASATITTPVIEPAEPPKPLRKRVTNRPANTDGRVLILQYHHVGEKEDRWTRSRVKFKKDLYRLYKLGYRPVTMSEYLDDRMDLASGASPVIMTFDDSHSNQFRLLPNGEIDPQCAVGIWRTFAQAHPDFPVKAVFYVVPRMYFGQKKHLKRKMELLKEWGCDVDVHTVSHSNLSKLTDQEVKAEIAWSIEWIRDHGFEPRSIALPYGVAPKNRALLKQFEYRGKTYKLDAAVLAGAEPARPPGADGLNLYRLPRVQAIDGPYGIHYWLDRAKADKTEIYVAP